MKKKDTNTLLLVGGGALILYMMSKKSAAQQGQQGGNPLGTLFGDAGTWFGNYLNSGGTAGGYYSGNQYQGITGI